MGFSGVNRTNRDFELYIINNGQDDLSFTNWTTTDDQFSVSTWDNDYSNDFFPFVIRPMSSSWINNVRQMWLRFYPNTSGEQSSQIVMASESIPSGITFNVSGFGYDIPESVINVPGDVPNIQFALDNSQWGDTIKVSPGTYQENIWLSDKEIYLVGDSENLPTIMHNPVNGHYSVIEMYSASNTLIKNFRITDGKGTWIGGNHGPNGDNYVGEFKDGKKNGHGTYTSYNGDKYVGEFKDEKPNGHGTYTWSDGETYVGEYKDGEEHGHGTYTFNSGSKYVGEYKDGKPNGHATYTWINAVSYTHLTLPTILLV